MCVKSLGGVIYICVPYVCKMFRKATHREELVSTMVSKEPTKKSQELETMTRASVRIRGKETMWELVQNLYATKTNLTNVCANIMRNNVGNSDKVVASNEVGLSTC